MQRPEATPGTTFSQPIRAITTMLVVCVLVAVGVWLIHGQVEGILFTNPVLNGLILFVFLLGVVTCFWQVWTLAKSVSWIEGFVRRDPGADQVAPPSMLAPLAALLRSRGRGLAISASSGRTILDSVAQRLDEGRDVTRYLINLLVFLGLLGTFWGLATTVPAVVETIRSLAPQEGDSGLDVFGKLMTGLESQLGGMGTAFSSSLLGLAGSLVLGLLELFAGHGQSRFYRELEEWLSSITRIGLHDGEGGSADQSAIVQVLDHMAGQMESLQMLYTQADVARSVMEDRVNDLAVAVDRLANRLGDQAQGAGSTAAALAWVAEGQEKLVTALAGGISEGGGVDAESRMRLRSIDVQMLRILEEISAGRQETVADLRADLAALTAAIRQLSRGAPAGRG
ncbi:biopolymer transporter ExbB [Neotabrizicola sp. VNH66]|uniref:biopolymer transporter ExbB n=1 Tax=Neotabrizicola sp. VNH66 TaxID=3400918 RepID=UPI003C03A8B1